MEELRRGHGGAITPRHVLDDARSPRSPLHPEFEWDDEKAAESFRLSQASSMLRSLVVVHEDEDRVRQYAVVTLPSREGDDGPTAVYVGMHEALSDPAMRGQVLARALDELKAFKRKYESLAELAGVIRSIDEATVGEKRAGSKRAREATA